MTSFGTHSLPFPGDRVLLIAPHPDDESLPLGGLLADCPADAWALYLTHGDAYRWAAARRFHTWPGPATMQALGTLRLEETRRATAALGMGEPAFLGFPDRGLAAMWLHGWSGPITSPFTGLGRAPATARESDAPYTAQVLLAAMMAYLRERQPDVVYCPDSLDDHPDHWATNCFVRMALARLEKEGWRPRVVRSYLVHRGSWPAGASNVSRDLTPPLELQPLPVEWEVYRPSLAGLKAKRSAIEAHASQTAVSGGYLRSFLRRSELLAHWPLATSGTWLPDAVCDRPLRSLLAGADIARLGLFHEGTSWRLRVEARARPHPLCSYRAHWACLTPSQPRVRSTPLGADLACAVPDEDVSGPLLISASVWAAGFQIDQSPWYELRPQAGS